MVELLRWLVTDWMCTLLTTLVLGLAALQVVAFAWGRLMRHHNIRAQGWPPPHLDADGDTVRREERL